MKDNLLKKLSDGTITSAESDQLLDILHQRVMRLARTRIKKSTPLIKLELQDAMLENRHIYSIIKGIEFVDNWFLLNFLTK